MFQQCMLISRPTDSNLLKYRDKKREKQEKNNSNNFVAFLASSELS